ncbi:hypothetical protein K466DRAFT_602339 [Polyporus arcularius HHB13444]|uniref:MYND-type domain-containing protein n=1 Tax=Polyporus arcularius HHB13444 TaxID=1314778 RepID=A0A5C3P497_9APHY|nr:hypothetical protein K466DRAFT_602339 [Polyporus arcularius HHB13444]
MSPGASVQLLTSGHNQVDVPEHENRQGHSKCEHVYCRKGLFYNRKPVHTHPKCHKCKKTRCKESATFQLRRCANCHLDEYCSEECQNEAWQAGHNQTCSFFTALCKKAAEIAGTPNAWPDLAAWVRFHDNSLMNAALSCYVALIATQGNVSTTHFLAVHMLYKDDPAVPPERRFELVTADFVHKDAPQMGPLYSYMAPAREQIMSGFWGTGSYIILAHFRPLDDPTGAIPFYKHFGISEYHASATLACRPPLEQLKENLELGAKMRFCCTKSFKGGDKCCCGGWTHKKISE